MSKLTDPYQIDCTRATALAKSAAAMVCDRDHVYGEAGLLLLHALDIAIRSGDGPLSIVATYDATIEQLQIFRAKQAGESAPVEVDRERLHGAIIGMRHCIIALALEVDPSIQRYVSDAFESIVALVAPELGKPLSPAADSAEAKPS